MTTDDLSLIAMIGDVFGQLQTAVYASSLNDDKEFVNGVFSEVFGGPGGSRKVRTALRVANQRCARAFLARTPGSSPPLPKSSVDIAVDGFRLKLGLSVFGTWVVGAISPTDVVRRSTPPLPLAAAARYFHLTRRESDVAEHLARGRANDEIAQFLGISKFTSRRHTERVLLKLGVRSRAQVAAVLLGLADRGRKAG